MLRDRLADYLEQVEEGVRALGSVYVERYDVEVLTPDRINLRIRIRFHSRAVLEISEAAILNRNQIEHLGYRCHLQDVDNQLVFRYDNTPHFPQLSSFPHHKHVSNEVVTCYKPKLIDVLKDALNWEKGQLGI